MSFILILTIFILLLLMLVDIVLLKAVTDMSRKINELEQRLDMQAHTTSIACDKLADLKIELRRKGILNRRNKDDNR